MSEHFVYQYIAQRIRELAYNEYYLEYKDFILQPATVSPGGVIPSVREIQSNNGILFVLDDPDAMIVTSEYGRYDSQGNDSDNNHKHKGTIEIQNYDVFKKRLKCIIAVIVS